MSGRPPSTYRVFQSDIARFRFWVRRQYGAFLDYVFNITQLGAFRRKRLIQILGLMGWFLLAMISHPPPFGNLLQEPIVVMIEFGYAFVAPDVLRHVIVVYVAYWVAKRHASIYLDDIFELGDYRVAERYIRQAAFGIRYDAIVIKDGEVTPQSRKSPIFRIGGPGLVQMHMENAALFEKITGEPHVIGSQGGKPILESFERLREVIDLRDQVENLTVHGRSKDGIRVLAKDIRLVFSVNRGEFNAGRHSDYNQPFSYSDDAVQKLIYAQNSEPWTGEMRNLIRENMRRFIAQHTLTEFLAHVSPKDRIKLSQVPSQPEAPFREPGDNGEPPGVNGDDFVPRDKITDLFYDFTTDFTKQADRLGVQLKWIGLGTWQTPSEIIPEQHLEAWQKSLENHILGSEASINEVRLESKNVELLRLISSVPLENFERMLEEDYDPDRIIRELILTYREKLRAAWEVYQNDDRQPPEELEVSIRHITSLNAHWI